MPTVELLGRLFAMVVLVNTRSSNYFPKGYCGEEHCVKLGMKWLRSAQNPVFNNVSIYIFRSMDVPTVRNAEY